MTTMKSDTAIDHMNLRPVEGDSRDVLTLKLDSVEKEYNALQELSLWFAFCFVMMTTLLSKDMLTDTSSDLDYYFWLYVVAIFIPACSVISTVVGALRSRKQHLPRVAELYSALNALDESEKSDKQ